MENKENQETPKPELFYVSAKALSEIEKLVYSMENYENVRNSDLPRIEESKARQKMKKQCDAVKKIIQKETPLKFK